MEEEHRAFRPYIYVGIQPYKFLQNVLESACIVIDMLLIEAMVIWPVTLLVSIKLKNKGTLVINIM